MRRLASILILSAVCLAAPFMNAAAQEDWWNSDPTLSQQIDGSAVTANRALSRIGVKESRLDSLSLRENIALSMGDVLAFNSEVFVKEYGRGSLTTVSFRGTGASHTQVLWNGIKINSPMLGMTDFSTIPSHFMDSASLLYGTSSVTEAGGGLGGAVVMDSQIDVPQGFGATATLGYGSFSTADGFLKLTYGTGHWGFATRVAATSSENDFRYRNYNKKIEGQYPIDTNRSGQIRDLHILQEARCRLDNGDNLGVDLWWYGSERGIPMLSVDYRTGGGYSNVRTEKTLRSALKWNHTGEWCSMAANAGFLHTDGGYTFERDKGNGTMVRMVESTSEVNTIHGSFKGDFYPSRHLAVSAQLGAYQHFVESYDADAMTLSGFDAPTAGTPFKVGYRQARFELLSSVAVKWAPVQRLGLSTVLREELYGNSLIPVIPAFFADYLISRKGRVMAKVSASRNYRVPTLNDLYYMPGGNPDLLPEHGFTYDAGLSFAAGRDGLKADGELTWFDSYIKDWILWIPTFKGYWTAMNVQQVHSYGIEARGSAEAGLGPDTYLSASGSFAWTPSINQGAAGEWAPEAIGRQLVYVPEISASATAALRCRAWTFRYKWCHYSERFTTSDNDVKTRIGRVLPYYMNDVVIERQFDTRSARLAAKLAVNNIFNEEYESVLNRPMPRCNYELFLTVTPKFNKR